MIALFVALLTAGSLAQSQPQNQQQKVVKADKAAAFTPAKQSAQAQSAPTRFTQAQGAPTKSSVSALRHRIPRHYDPPYYDLPEGVLPESQCSADQAVYLSSYSTSSSDSSLVNSPARVQQHKRELVEPMEGAQEDPNERVQSMARVGED